MFSMKGVALVAGVGDDELVHDAAGGVDEVVFGALAEQGDLGGWQRNARRGARRARQLATSTEAEELRPAPKGTLPERWSVKAGGSMPSCRSSWRTPMG